MSNPAADEPIAWDEPLPDLTGVEWGELPRTGSNLVLNDVLAQLVLRSGALARPVAYYEDSP
ncbi:hypothetical protein PV396_03590 [Streptomyces sp. ME02-8801-2C]|uniref:hypothetical protein n=1 Tax=Streptomyces sp. ME02-8801-2C TaxID=3028680 RepID=UPI0029A5F840|nr:hypothetical protein [Streptomyces sp. ME02-8801-2C]MDX3451037.1 hypothetical protein [Streptomyces sp. ME02-8801-2C]